MGLTDAQQRLIRSISDSDMPNAKKCAIACLEEDTTAKNKWFVSKYKQILQSAGANMIELPYDLKNIMCVEDVSNSFLEDRYFLSEREEQAFDTIRRMKQVNEKLMEKGIHYLNSTLLYGESGTGKTTFGKYVAYRLGLPFCYLKFSDLVDSYMGNTSKNISKAFGYAISNPCVLMLDEIDCISVRRSEVGSSGGTGGEMARITITLMQEFDKLTNDIVVIGATNRMDRIDEALLRRFSLKHEVKAFTEKEKEKMIEKYLCDISMKIDENDFKLLVKSNQSQALILNDLIRLIAEQIQQDLVR